MKKYKIRVLKPNKIKLNIDFEYDEAIKFRDMIIVTAPDEKLRTNFARELMEVFKKKYPGTSLLLLPKGVELLEIEEILEDKEEPLSINNSDNVGC